VRGNLVENIVYSRVCANFDAMFRVRALKAHFELFKDFEESIGETAWKLTNPNARALRQSFGSIIKVYTVAASPNWLMPWQTKQQRESTGSGFIVAGNRIITNAHCVADQAHVMVRKHGDPTKYSARVVAVGHEVTSYTHAKKRTPTFLILARISAPPSTPRMRMNLRCRRNLACRGHAPGSQKEVHPNEKLPAAQLCNLWCPEPKRWNT